jgi:hypothetical protein
VARDRLRWADPTAGGSRAGVALTYTLESLIICSFRRELSVRDIEAALENLREAGERQLDP